MHCKASHALGGKHKFKPMVDNKPCASYTERSNRNGVPYRSAPRWHCARRRAPLSRALLLVATMLPLVAHTHEAQRHGGRAPFADLEVDNLTVVAVVEMAAVCCRSLRRRIPIKIESRTRWAA